MQLLVYFQRFTVIAASGKPAYISVNIDVGRSQSPHMHLANRIRQIREAYGFTQAEIAYKCDISPSAYGQIERKAGNSTFETLQKIATAIGVSVPFLVDISNDNFLEKNKL